MKRCRHSLSLVVDYLPFYLRIFQQLLTTFYEPLDRARLWKIIVRIKYKVWAYIFHTYAFPMKVFQFQKTSWKVGDWSSASSHYWGISGGISLIDLASKRHRWRHPCLAQLTPPSQENSCFPQTYATALLDWHICHFVPCFWKPFLAFREETGISIIGLISCLTWEDFSPHFPPLCHWFLPKMDSKP